MFYFTIFWTQMASQMHQKRSHSNMIRTKLHSTQSFSWLNWILVIKSYKQLNQPPRGLTFLLLLPCAALTKYILDWYRAIVKISQGPQPYYIETLCTTFCLFFLVKSLHWQCTACSIWTLKVHWRLDFRHKKSMRRL